MKLFILKFGKFKGVNFYETPIDYQNWLLKQDWFKLPIVQTENVIVKNTISFDDVLLNAQAFNGKTIYADGWHYDNSGFMSGIVTSVQKGNQKCVLGFPEIIISVIKTDDSSMNSFTFSVNQINQLLKNNELPVPSKLYNTGTYAKIS